MYIQTNISTKYKIPLLTHQHREQSSTRDALACLLFNIGSEKVIRDAAVNTRGNIFYKSVQILVHADDIDIIGRTQSVMIEAFTTLGKAAKGMILIINPEKTNCMPVTRKSHASYPHYLEVGLHKFQVVHRFTCRVRINYRRILQNHIFTNTEQK